MTKVCQFLSKMIKREKVVSTKVSESGYTKYIKCVTTYPCSCVYMLLCIYIMPYNEENTLCIVCILFVV